MPYRCKLCGEIVEDEADVEIHFLEAHADVIYEYFEEV